jgi:phospholipid-translocating ATPase
MHYKTWISALGWWISVIGWTLWNVALSAVYSNRNSTIYSVKGGFLKHFGGSGKWWLVIICIIDSVLIFEIVVQAIKKTWLPSDVDIWQVLEKDKVINRRLQEAAVGESGEPHLGAGGRSGGLQGKGQGGVMSKEDDEREIQDLLDRPKIMVMEPLTPIITAGSADGGSDYELHTRHSRHSTERVNPREM